MASWVFEPNALAQALQELRTDSLTTGNEFIVTVKKTPPKNSRHTLGIPDLMMILSSGLDTADCSWVSGSKPVTQLSPLVMIFDMNVGSVC